MVDPASTPRLFRILYRKRTLLTKVAEALMMTLIDEHQNMEIWSDDNLSLQAPSDTFEPAIPCDYASVQAQHFPPLRPCPCGWVVRWPLFVPKQPVYFNCCGMCLLNMEGVHGC